MASLAGALQIVMRGALLLAAALAVPKILHGSGVSARRVEGDSPVLAIELAAAGQDRNPSRCKYGTGNVPARVQRRRRKKNRTPNDDDA